MDNRLLDILVCPISKGKLVKRNSELWSKQAGLAYPVRNDTPVLIESEARQLTLAELESLKES